VRFGVLTMLISTLDILEQVHGQLISTVAIDAIVAKIVAEIRPLQILLFGSYANGHPTPDSDLDLLIVMATDRTKNKRSTPIRLLFQPMPCSMDVLVFTPEEVDYWKGTTNHIITEAFQTGKMLYDCSTS
jgi:uncharacterized protein